MVCWDGCDLEKHCNENPDHSRKQLAELVVAAAEGGVVSEDPIQPVGGRWYCWDTFGVDRPVEECELGGGTLS